MRGVNYRLDGLLGVLLAAEMLSSSGLVRKDCAQPAKRCVSKINSGAISAQPADLTHILCRREHSHSRNVLLLRAEGRRCGRSAVGFQAVGVAGASASLVALYISTLRNCRGRCPAYAGNTPKHMIIHEAKVVPKQLFYHIHSWLWVLASGCCAAPFYGSSANSILGPAKLPPTRKYRCVDLVSSSRAGDKWPDNSFLHRTGCRAFKLTGEGEEAAIIPFLGPDFAITSTYSSCEVNAHA